jgi:hypothetical protein
VQSDPARPGVQLALSSFTLDYIRLHIRWLREAVTLWDLIQSQDVKGLSRCINASASDNPNHPALLIHPDRLPGASDMVGTSPEVMWKLCRPGDVVLPAKLRIHGLLRAGLVGPDALRQNHCWDSDTMLPVVRIEPSNLLIALWLQFGEAFCRNQLFRRCPTCGTWFEVADGKARRSRLYCSEGCRSKAYRERREQARTLYAGGSSVEEIARELASDVEAVTKWVSETEE